MKLQNFVRIESCERKLDIRRISLTPCPRFLPHQAYPRKSCALMWRRGFFLLGKTLNEMKRLRWSYSIGRRSSRRSLMVRLWMVKRWSFWDAICWPLVTISRVSKLYLGSRQMGAKPTHYIFMELGLSRSVQPPR
jgi:hypothetical protein